MCMKWYMQMSLFGGRAICLQAVFIMCISPIVVHTSYHPRRHVSHHRGSNPTNLLYPSLSIQSIILICAGLCIFNLWSYILSLITLLGTYRNFDHTREFGNTCSSFLCFCFLALSLQNWKRRGHTFKPLSYSYFNISSFQFHCLAVTHPTRLYISVVYLLPGAAGTFLEELDILLSSFPDDDCPLVLLGDSNLRNGKLHT